MTQGAVVNTDVRAVRAPCALRAKRDFTRDIIVARPRYASTLAIARLEPITQPKNALIANKGSMAWGHRANQTKPRRALRARLQSPTR